MRFIQMIILFVKILFSKPKQAVKVFEPLKLDLQFFADSSEGDEPEDPQKKPEDQPTKVEFTTEQQAELDRILKDRLGKAQTKWEKDYQTKLAEAKTEAEKLAKMNAEQKAEYERQQRETKLTEREAEITRRELRATALETLAEKSLPKTLADILIYTDAEATNASLVAVETAFRTAVEAGVNERLRSEPPGGGGTKGGGSKNPWSKEHFNLTEQGKILRDNPELATQLKSMVK
ncbi:DUF4355 domain-containing protein [Metasolibacillus meyeri]|uniref:DUF4355 domain-containing protein n=1 Tax=Metasolibacillus meyeri TaxID=1071052 RepID=A0AAW9NT43_9BACL|nr:DUF4355 domain-containing protein [Metasolibacillus meyeri]MEC1177625.1 DUF4355 domain-containing protein [Metasolibacillus meyeri]